MSQQQPWGPPPQPGPYPPAGPPAQGGGGAIAITLKYHPIAFLMALFKPVLEINGQPAPRAWGRQVIPLAPGNYHVHAHVPYLLPPRIGSADLGVTLMPGQTVELEYRAPTIAFMNGALGTPPQKTPGLAASIALLIVAFVLLLCVCGGVVLGILADTSTTNGMAQVGHLAADLIRLRLTT